LMPSALTFFRPGSTFPAVSVTGKRCDLQCDHCRGHYLQGMHAIHTLDELLSFALDLEGRGGEGFLISGGCDERGKIPLSPFIGAISRIKGRTKLLINAHTGLLDEEEARSLVGASIDCFSLDVLQDDETIRNVLHLPASGRDYEGTVEALFTAGARTVVPHICIGLSSETGEMRSIEMLSRYPISALIMLVFVPTRGTPLQDKPPSDDERVIGAVRRAADSLSCPIILGCMRPRGRSDLEIKSIEEGISGIALPSRQTVEWAIQNGYEIEERKRCCALYL